MKFDPTKPVQTRDGRKARILCTDKASETHPIIAEVFREGDDSSVHIYMDSGMYVDGATHELDLINIPEKHVRYINFYDDDITGTTMKYKSRADADANAIPDRLACVRVEYEDGQFDD